MQSLDRALAVLDIDFAGVVKALNKQAGIFLNIFAGVGVLLVAFGVFNYVTSMESHDNAQKIRAGLMIGAGVILISARAFMVYIMPAGTMDGI